MKIIKYKNYNFVVLPYNLTSQSSFTIDSSSAVWFLLDSRFLHMNINGVQKTKLVNDRNWKTFSQSYELINTVNATAKIIKKIKQPVAPIAIANESCVWKYWFITSWIGVVININLIAIGKLYARNRRYSFDTNEVAKNEAP